MAEDDSIWPNRSAFHVLLKEAQKPEVRISALIYRKIRTSRKAKTCGLHLPHGKQKLLLLAGELG